MSISCTDQSDKTFSKKTRKVQKDSILYIFSDGIADQFGGPADKKFMVRRLRELILDCASLGMQEQRAAIIESFDNWKQNEHDQIDDVMLLGIQL